MDRPDSDIDLLVEFTGSPNHVLRPSPTMEEELSGLSAAGASTFAPGRLSRYFRDEVLGEAEVQYSPLISCRLRNMLDAIEAASPIPRSRREATSLGACSVSRLCAPSRSSGGCLEVSGEGRACFRMCVDRVVSMQTGCPCLLRCRPGHSLETPS